MGEERTRAGRQAALLFAIGAARALLASLASPDGGVPELWLGLVDVALVAVALRVPWQRLPAWATLLLALPAFTVMAATEALGLVPERASGVAFVVAFAWVGAHHSRWTSLPLLLPAALAYSLPTWGDLDVRALLLTLAVCALVAEILAHARETAAASQLRAEQAAHAFRVVAQASAGLHLLDPESVLDAVADAVIALRYDGASLAVLDSDQVHVRVRHARGLAQAFSTSSFVGSEGMTGQVRRTGHPLVVEDYQDSHYAVEEISDAGVRSTIAVPVFRGDRVEAVLYASSAKARTVAAEEVEVLRILAATAGAALEGANELLAERTSAELHATAALTDPLTGVGNRRHAQQLLEWVRPGDSLVMIDLDEFKGVNDLLGHTAGDDVLRALADHLVNTLRLDDWIARYGGEEFLVVLSAVPPERAELAVKRLLESWRATEPVTTFSAGVAHHTGGPPAETLERADRALFAAKRAGRDTWRAERAGVPAQALPALRIKALDNARQS